MARCDGRHGDPAQSSEGDGELTRPRPGLGTVGEERDGVTVTQAEQTAPIDTDQLVPGLEEEALSIMSSEMSPKKV